MAALLFASCDDSSTSAPPSPKVPNEGTWDLVMTFPILERTDDALVTRYPRRIDSWCRMQDSSGTVVQRIVHDTVAERMDTIRFRLDAQDKLYFEGGDTDEGIEGLVNIWSEWTRQSGTPSTLDGIWDHSFRDTVDVAYGEVPDSALSRILARERSIGTLFKDAGQANQIEIHSNTLVSRGRYGEPAAIELVYWDLYEKDLYDLVLERLDANTLRYIGEGETVTVTYDGHRSRTFTSTEPLRKPYTVISEPKKDADCPEIPWFDEFMGKHYRQNREF